MREKKASCERKIGDFSCLLVRSARRTLSLSLDREGRVVVRAPLRLPAAEIDRFVLRHAAWIAKKRALFEQRDRLDLSTGSLVTLFGKTYRVAVGRARLSGDLLYLPEEGREAALARLLKKEALSVMSEMTERLAREHGFSYQNVRISSARTRWGTCNREGTIAYSFRVAFLAPELAEYIAVHELCHTRYFDHSPSFWREVEKIIPDRKERRRAVKESVAMSYL